MAKNKRVALGMSGGVDSSTSAAILLKEGFEVEGVTCLFIDEEKAWAAAADAKNTCERLGITHHSIDCTDRFDATVVSPFVCDYAKGLTPSPCVGCNVLCKIPSLLEVADSLDCDYVATGHYAQIEKLTSTGRYAIKKAADTTKDQSYMLSQLSQEQLGRLLLPLGTTTKTRVRAQAQEMNLSVADKPDSQDICFIDGSHLDFLRERGIDAIPGNIIDSTGEVLGTHEGLFAYTIGQRKGIGVAADQPYYVIEKRHDTNDLVIGFKEEAYISGVEVSSMSWQAYASLEEWQAKGRTGSCSVKLRYRSQPAKCMLCSAQEVAGEKGKVSREGYQNTGEEPQCISEGHQSIEVKLATPQPSTAPGQYAVFYEDDILIGGGMISQVWR